ncbi:phage baseplate assembly protein V [Chitinimonas sp. BJB300]|uniref:phage baseplate assembly protein V n=1 Tax=Chitinimonas sp. BJB300 TaxID=1559339 RepID=UPI000C0EA392|nr:phage baseplate assembly protein V [Chitinimonas sp. BJB300]PHV11315.1 baseplate assembly protein [Chitinimonas sp. BJB300]TSJ88208.1 phage baseplate assembly protein V [Chitinimonas sp. BJB300]
MPNYADLSRRFESLIRSGTITAIDHTSALCRVKTGSLETEWLPWLERRAGDTRTWNPPTVGEQVLVLCPSGEVAAGFVLLGLYSAQKPAPDSQPHTHVITFPDGAYLCYDHALGALIATGIKTALLDASGSITAKAGQTLVAEVGDSVTIKAGGSVTIDAPTTTITGNLVVQKALSFMGGMSGSGGAGGAVATINGAMQIQQGGLTVSGDVVAGGVSLKSHTHQEQGDGAPTSPPLGG